MPLRNSSISSSRRRRGWGPIGLAILAYGALLASWQLLAAAELPPRIFDTNERDGRAEWLESIGLFLTYGDVQHSELLILGDSRARDDIVLAEIEQQGFESCAILWSGAERTSVLLSAARLFPARRLLVALSTLGFSPPRSGVGADARLLAGPPLELDDFRAGEAAWKVRSVEQLVALGRKPERARLVVDGLADLYEEHLGKGAWTPDAIDHRLAEWLDTTRVNLLRVVPTNSWNSSWFYETDPHFSDADYTTRSNQFPPAAWRLVQDEVALKLKALRLEGWDIVCVRLPVGSHLLPIEEQAVAAEDFVRVTDEAGVPFLDYSRSNFRTRDGSHLIYADAVPFTRLLARDLKQYW